MSRASPAQAGLVRVRRRSRAAGDRRGLRGQGDDKGEAVDGHAEFVARHFGGGVEATPELGDRAIEVWQRSPGAVVRGPGRSCRTAVASAGDKDKDKGKGAAS
jgi:hypothetical protein